MPERYYCADLPDSGDALLDGSEAHHLLNVMRAEVGDRVELFDGHGTVAEAVIASKTRRDVRLTIESRQTLAPPNGPRLTIAVALPKGDRAKWLVEKITELGAAHLVPLLTARGVVDAKSTKLNKLRQTVIAACKQSGRVHLLTIEEPTPLSEVINTSSESTPVWMADPEGDSLASLGSIPQDLTLLIGPEGGFTDEERSEVRTGGVRLVKYAPHVLRVETAAVAGTALVLASG